MSTLKVGEIKHESFTGTTQLKLDSAGRLLVGTTTEGQASADDLTIATTGNTGITVRSGTSNAGNIYFSDATSGTAEYAGYLSYSHSTNSLSFGTNDGTERMRIDSSGNVGIGTTSPDVGNSAYKVLQVHSSSTNAYFKLSNDTTGSGSGDGVELSLSGSDAFLTNRESANLIFRTAATERMRISSDGYVGIGTTSPDKTGIQNGVKVLQIDGGDGAELILGNSTSQNVSVNHIGAIAFKNIDTSTGNAPHYAGIRSNCVDTSGNMNLKFYAGSTDFEADTPHMLIGATGKVGIGTTSPQQDIHIGASGGDVAKAIRIDGTNNTSGGEVHRFVIENYGPSALVRFKVSAANATEENILTMHSINKNIFIHSQNSSGSNGRIYTNRANANVTTLEVNQNGGSGTEMITFRNGGSQLGTIHQSGSGVSYQSQSDYRLKENDVVISDGITRLKQLRPIRFNWKTDTSTVVDGFFAHEVSAVVPEAVRGKKDEVFDTDGVGTQKKGDPKYQQLEQSKLVPLLVAALQEAIGRIEALEAK